MKPTTVSPDGIIIQGMPLRDLGRIPATIECPFCGQHARTRTTEENSQTTLLVGVGLFFTTFFGACLPSILHWYPDVDHFCTCCDQQVVHIPHKGERRIFRPDPVGNGDRDKEKTPVSPPVSHSPPDDSANTIMSEKSSPSVAVAETTNPSPVIEKTSPSEVETTTSPLVAEKDSAPLTVAELDGGTSK